MAKIKKGDLVQVITGAKPERGGDRGKQGKVLEILAERNRIIVEGVNYVTKHTRVGQTQRGSHPHLERRTRRPFDQEADQGRPPGRGADEGRREAHRPRAVREEVR